MLFWPALEAGVIGVSLTTAPGASLALVRLRTSPTICRHGRGDEVRARARHLSLRVVAEWAPQGCCRTKVPQVVGAGGNVLSVHIESGMVTLRQVGVAGIAAAEDYGAGEMGTGVQLGRGKWDGVNPLGRAGFSRWRQSHCGCLGCSHVGGVVCFDSGSCCWRRTVWDSRIKGMPWEPLPHWGCLQISTDLACKKEQVWF